jgi:hypothetical protein
MFVTVAAASAGLGVPAAQAAKHPEGMDIRAASAHGQVPARNAKSGTSPRRNPDMLWHNGAIMNDSQVTAIYWGRSWSASDTKVTQLGQFYTGFSGSNYAATSAEYTGTNGSIGNSVSYNGALVDNSSAPSGAPSTTTILNEVASQITNPVSDGYYPVYVDTKRGSARYCAWHSYGTINGTPVQFAFFFNLDGDAGCDPQDGTTGHSQGVAALGNVSAHELSEARTDPRNGGWYDGSGAENGDKCAWTFNVNSVKLGTASWKLQGEWSNHAYDTGVGGYPNSSGQKGCLDGH